MSSLLDPQHLITTFGLIGVALVLFAETGLLIGFFLPGDSLLFIAGLMTTGDTKIAPLWALLLVTVTAAFVGDQTGYQIGKSTGPAVLRSRAGRMIGDERINKAHEYFAKYGARTVVIARFVPIVRTVVPVLAGINEMPRKTFVKWNLIGAFLWGTLLPIAGHYLGEIAFIRDHVDLIVVGIILLSLIPVVIQVVTTRKSASS